MNWVSILVASLIPLAMGFLWYGVLFKKIWMDETGIKEENARNGYHPAVLFVLTYLLSISVSYGLYGQIVKLHNFINTMKGGDGVVTEHPFFHGMLHGCQDTFLYGAVTFFVINALYEQKSFKYIALNVGYIIASMALMGGVIGLMG